MRLPLSTIAILALCLSSARGASLPAAAVGEDTVAVIWLDAARIDLAQLSATAKALLGDTAKELEDPIKQYAALREAFTKVGGKSLAIVMRGPDARGRTPEPHFVVTFGNDADAQVVTDALRLIGGQDIAIVPAGKGSLIVARRERLLPPPSEGGATHKAFDKALADVGDSPAAVVFIANQALRNELASVKSELPEREKQVKGITKLYDLFDHMLQSERAVLTCQLGEGPRLSLNVTTKDSAAARALVASVKSAGDAAEVLAKELAQAGRGDPGIEMMSNLLRSIDPKAQGREVVAMLEGKALQQFAAGAAKGMMEARAKANEFVYASQMRQVLIGIIAYADDNNGAYPDSLADLEPKRYIDKLAPLLRHPGTGEAVAMKYVKPAGKRDDVKPDTAILFETQDGKVKEDGYIGYADGSVRKTTPKPATTTNEKQ